jgi:hypothetical protein
LLDPWNPNDVTHAGHGHSRNALESGSTQLLDNHIIMPGIGARYRKHYYAPYTSRRKEIAASPL